jgi:phosphoribosylformylglycinamidine cyclo-ligase
MKLTVHDEFPGEGKSVGDLLLAIHRSYLQLLKPLLPKIHAMAHITGGGIPGNLNRALPSHLDAVVATSSWKIPNVFHQLEQAGGVARHEMFRTFNMGVGMVVIAGESHVADILASADAHGVHAWRLGDVQPGTGQVIFN